MTKFNLDIEAFFSLLLGKCSPSVAQSLAGENDYKVIKEMSEPISLITVSEDICYNYQSHEFASLTGWGSLDRPTATRQHKEVLEADPYEKFKMFLKVCKASGIKFSLLCTENVDMSIKMLKDTGEVTTTGVQRWNLLQTMYQR